jgi:phosphoserine phosphatase RsbU/P
VRILIAEDETISRRVLESTLARWGYEVISTCDGTEAWGVLQAEGAPDLAILDIMMPGLDGIELCRWTRRVPRLVPTYIILLTAKTTKEQVVIGLDAGADDYIAKPFDRDELRARVNVGVRMIDLQRSLAERLREREETLAQVKTLQGLLPICSYCKSIRDDQNYWQHVESYLSDHTDARLSHGVCPNCYAKVVEPELERIRLSKQTASQS